MAKIYRTIKKLRTGNKLTQEGLAEKLNVTRQTVSSWETGRTQPDIEMLEAIAAVFDVSIEELIYGEKKTEDMKQSDKRRKTNGKIIGIIFAVIGSLFVIGGATLIFVNFWLDFPLPVQTAFSIIPLGAGMAFALYVLKNKSENKVLCEVSCSAWCIGLVSTYALINSIYAIDLGFSRLLIADAVFVLLASVLMRSVVGMTGFHIMINILLFSEIMYDLDMLTFHDESKGIVIGYCLCYILLLVAGGLVIFLCKWDETRKCIMVWEYVVSLALGSIIFMLQFDSGGWGIVAIIEWVLLAIYAADNNKRRLYPFRYPAVALLMLLYVYMAVCSIVEAGYYSEWELSAQLVTVVSVLLLVAAGVIIGKDGLKNNPLKIAFIAVSALGSMLISVQKVPIIVTVALGVLLIVAGSLESRILTANLGLVSICTVLITAIIVPDMSIFIKGLLCVIIGIFLIAVNIVMSKVFAGRKEREVDA